MRSPVPETDVIAGRYILATHIGIGSTATVYRAWDPHEDRAVAVKLFLDRCDTGGVDRQCRELRAMAHLDHRNLVRLLGVDRGRPFLVCELVEGETLAARLARGALSAAQVAGIGADIASGLAHLHARGVVHRDVKPANILLCAETGRARLTDFGIARVLAHSVLTRTDAVLGTAAYLAPEQVAGEAVTPAADVYALGLVLIEALTGEREYPGTTVESAVARLHRSPRVPDGLPVRLRRMLSGMTSRQPGGRATAAGSADRLGAHRPGTHR
ncbi:serine/threonine-protein kinase [Pseudonocardia sp. ICBG1293]|uniref:serine/threonine-protein kinase n=1 Tax=Pseudonocardia sp. ICBG1293 TaxID=2844382 RepID=UPI001CCA4020|nr:serine/threonine-protein kinase [Pseudonocardia sp. ICBG1293]